MNDIQRAKQTRYFHQFDVDRSGTVSWKDFEDSAKNIAAWRQYEPDSEIYNMLLQLLRTYWSNIARFANNDQDGHVTLSEWLAWREHLLTLTDEELHTETSKLIEAMFKIIDEDGNGGVTLDEYLQIATSFNTEPAITAHNFKQMDSDADALITDADHRKATIKFVRGDDREDLASTHFFGPLDSVGMGRAFKLNAEDEPKTLLQHKVVHLFTLFDTDGNGGLDLSDFVKVGDNVAAIGGVELNSADHDAITNEYRLAWASILKVCDTDDNDRVSLSEFSRWAASVASLDQESFLAETNFLSQFLWDVMDSDKSGCISRHEYMMLASAYRIPPRYAAKAFGRLDIDHSGSITKDEYLAAVVQFFTSEDASSVGNWLFGPI